MSYNFFYFLYIEIFSVMNVNVKKKIIKYNYKIKSILNWTLIGRWLLLLIKYYTSWKGNGESGVAKIILRRKMQCFTVKNIKRI